MNSTPKSASKSSQYPATHFARLSCDETTARMLADRLAESVEAASVAAYANAAGSWSVELHVAGRLDAGALRNLVRAAAGEAVAHTLNFGNIAERDWVAASLAGLKPVAAGRFLVHGAHDRTQARRVSVAIEIEAALAFGTGHHGTTRGCLLAFDRLLRARRPRRILDIGTGTGVLAIAAAKTLRCRVVATDIDIVAVRVARDNARLNCVAAWCDAIQARGVDAHAIRRHAPYDLVFANILLPPLKLMAAPLARLLAPNARVILSGLLTDHANAALAAYRAQGVALERKQILDGWATLTLRKTA